MHVCIYSGENEGGMEGADKKTIWQEVIKVGESN
jgi:hypothetical protein